MAGKGDAILRFRIRGSNQAPGVALESVNSFAKNFTNIILNQIAIQARDQTFQNAKNKLVNNVRAAINREIAQMSFMVGRFIVQPNGARGPSGTVSAFDANISETALANRWQNTVRFDLSKSGAHWAGRTFNYLMWKEKKGAPLDWWHLTGNLQGKLSKQSFYTENFGPVQVSFVRNNEADGDFKRVTSVGSGRVTTKLHVGSITVSVLSRITPEMLPALANNDPAGGAKPSGKQHVTDLIGDKDIRNKLSRLAHDGSYRPVLEPFLAYYLTRAIPNSIFRVTERLVSEEARFNASENGKKSGGLGAQFEGT